MNPNLAELINDYKTEKIVPFVGAGLSIPFGVPSWANLIREIANPYCIGNLEWLKNLIETDLGNNDFWKAIDNLLEYTSLNESSLNEKVADIIFNKQKNIDDDELHNYKDLSKMNFNLYLTTNYENYLQEYLRFRRTPVLLRDIDFNTQNLIDRQQIFQLHGNISNSGTIVLSRASYKKLYDDKKYNQLFGLITGTNKLLFLGFSFDDQFIKALISGHKEVFNGEHYILLNQPTIQQEKELSDKYGLKVIPYNAEKSTHTIEIRKILNTIKNSIEKQESNETEKSQLSPKKIRGTGLSAFKQNLQQNLFYRKLELENIDIDVVKLCATFYVAAEQYIRDLNDLGMSIDVVDIILGQVFMEHHETLVEEYKVYGDSVMFVQSVHKKLEDLDSSRYIDLIESNTSTKSENKGFVHVLADNENEDIWWGNKRL